jgi:hypothetical protein
VVVRAVGIAAAVVEMQTRGNKSDTHAQASTNTSQLLGVDTQVERRIEARLEGSGFDGGLETASPFMSHLLVDYRLDECRGER